MKTRSHIVSFAAFAVVALSVGALSAAPPVMVPPPLQASTTMSCAGERQLRVEVDQSKNVSVSMSKPAGAASWLTELTLSGKIMLTNGHKPCGTTAMRIVADDPDARAALQTCAKIGSSLGAGQHFYVNLMSTEAAKATAGNGLTYTKPIEITCGVE